MFWGTHRHNICQLPQQLMLIMFMWGGIKNIAIGNVKVQNRKIHNINHMATFCRTEDVYRRNIRK